MNAVLFKSKSRNKINLLLQVAKEFGVQSTVLSSEKIEDIALANAVLKGRTGEYIDTDEFLKKLNAK